MNVFKNMGKCAQKVSAAAAGAASNSGEKHHGLLKSQQHCNVCGNRPANNFEKGSKNNSWLLRCGFSLTRPSEYRQRIPNLRLHPRRWKNVLPQGELMNPLTSITRNYPSSSSSSVDWPMAIQQQNGSMMKISSGFKSGSSFWDAEFQNDDHGRWQASKQHLVDLPQDEWSLFLHPSVVPRAPPCQRKMAAC